MSARHYPYTGGDPGSPYFDAVPTWLNDLLLEQTPGREMRNFRLAVRKAWVMEPGAIPMNVLVSQMVWTSGAAYGVALTCLVRLGDPTWPQTREEEDRRAQQA